MAEDWYVDPDASGEGTGVDWTNAYTDLETALAAKEDNLSGKGVVTFHCQSGSGTADTDHPAAVDGWSNADSSNYVVIQGDNTSQKYNTSAYRMESNSSTVRDFLTISIDYTEVHNIQCHHSGSRDYHEDIQTSVDNCVIESCICWYSGSAGNIRGVYVNNGDGNAVFNNIVYGHPLSGLYSSSSTVDNVMYNNTIYGCGLGLDTGWQDTVAINNISYNCTTDFNGTFSPGSDYNFSEDGTEPGSNGGSNSVDSWTPDFVSTTGGSEDFSLQSTSDAIDNGNGATPKSYFTDDIVGTSRPGTDADWDIGAFEYVAAGGGLSIPIAMHHLMHQ